MNFKNLRSGVLVVAGLLTACGGEVQEPVTGQDDTGSIEGRALVSYTTAMGESVPCDNNYLIFTNNPSPYTLSQCRLWSNYSHQYRTSEYVLLKAGNTIFVEADGHNSGGVLVGDHTLFVGTTNGYVTFKDDSVIGLRTGSFAGQAGQGVLKQDTCVKKSDGTYIACRGNTSLQFDTGGNAVASTCQFVSGMTCP